MSAQPERHLRSVTEADQRQLDTEALLLVVDPNTGERISTLAEYIQPIKDELAGAQTDVRSWQRRFANLKRDREAEAKEQPNFPVALRVFTYWREACNHPNSTFDLARYESIAKILEAHKGGPDKLNPYDRAEKLCRLAIDGAAFDPFTKPLKRGGVKRFDSIDLIFRDADKFEDFCNRAPAPAKVAEEPPPTEDPGPEQLTIG